jgi:peptidoglycan/xylan/chitin deacetylase (PgdA/CDA1 family)
MRAIFTYHSIDSSGSAISISEETFRDHLRFFGSGRVTVVPLADLPSMPDDSDAIALTFDDGFLNFSSTVQPQLSHLGVPATVFVVSDCVGGSNAWGGSEEKGIPTLPLMSWSDVERIHDAGIEIGAHTRHHVRLTRLSPAQLEDETAGCVERIFAELGVRPQRFAYPYGDVDDSVARVTRSVFRQSVTTELRPVSGNEDPALLPRLDAWYFRKAGALQQWGSSAFRRRLWIRAQARRVKAIFAPSVKGRPE